ncbi:MAG: DNA cytosine methyltransferase [Holophaga sp.]|jgi:DNA (cytosine-5)-methyltransferase 1/tRNA (cytosine38-C5)-methyltransferase
MSCPLLLELFSGLGGWSFALDGRGTVAAAYDISLAANETYRLNHGLAPRTRELARVRAEEIGACGADTWVLSPPCQPFCRMGNREGLDDRRSSAFLHLLEVLREAPPRRLVLENVEGFLDSPAHRRLDARLGELGFRRLAYRLCPSRFGLPNLRPRAFIVASRGPLEPREPPDLPPPTLEGFLDPEEDPALYLDPERHLRHRPGLDLVTPESRRTACFIGGYGQRFVGSGSFLRTPRGIRRFSPGEVARLLGLPQGFRFPPDLGLEQRYRLLGNSLSIPVARWVLEQVL